MKKLTLLAATALIALSCSEADIDTLSPSTPSEGTKISINVTTPESGAATRIAVSEDTESDAWVTSWLETDMLGGYASGDSYFTEFAIEELHSSKSATFTGYAYGDDIRLVYPYPTDEVIASTYSPSLATQSVAFGTFENLSSYSYMVAESIITGLLSEDINSVAGPKMVHVGGALDLSFRFINIPDDVTASISKIEVGGNGGVDIPTAVDIDLSKSTNDEGIFTYGSNGAITLNVADYTIVNCDDTDATTYSIPFNIFPFAVASGENLAIKLYVDYKAASGVVSEQTVLLESENTSTSTISFDSGTYSSINKAVDMSEAVLDAKAVTVIGQSINPYIASFDMDIDKAQCYGYAYDFDLTAKGTAGKSLVDDIASGDAKVTSFDGIIKLGAEGAFLSPNSEYTLALQPVKLSGGSYKIVDQMYYYDFATPQLTIGAYDVSTTIVIASWEATSSSVNIYATNSDDAIGFVYGLVEAEGISDATAYVEEYIAAGGTLQYQPFTDGVIEAKVAISGLNDATNYLAFALPVTTEGGIGNLATSYGETSMIYRDETYTPTIDLNISNTGFKATITFNDCDKVFLYNQATVGNDLLTEEEIEDKFYADTDILSTGYKVGNATNGVITHENGMLEMGQTYRLYYMGASNSGTYGYLQYIEYTTISPSYTSLAAVTTSDNTERSWWENTAEYGTYLYLYIDVVPNSHTAGFYYCKVTDADVINSTDPVVWGNYIVSRTKYNSTMLDEENVIYYEFYNETSAAIILPYDSNGEYGTATLHRTSLWPSTSIDDDTSNPDIELH